MDSVFLLSQLPPGGCGKVSALLTDEQRKERLAHLGLVQNAYVECVGQSPLGDPRAYSICGATIALRREESALIQLSDVNLP